MGMTDAPHNISCRHVNCAVAVPDSIFPRKRSTEDSRKDFPTGVCVGLQANIPTETRMIRMLGKTFRMTSLFRPSIKCRKGCPCGMRQKLLYPGAARQEAGAREKRDIGDREGRGRGRTISRSGFGPRLD